LNYNYCILFPIFDIIFGTYRSNNINKIECK
jgi:sterol desaturase/sphingolipid hydroxylase (fatty acid hydroxylase superfamily)